MKLFLLILLFPILSFADSSDSPFWFISLGSGTGYNFPMPLKIKTDNNPEINITAKYELRPFHESGYYLYRIGRRDHHNGWEVEFIHHKLYLVTDNPNIQHFEVTHGYNLLSVNRIYDLTGNNLLLRFGLGLVIPHPETTIYNESYPQSGGLFNEGYYVSGVSTSIGLGKEWDLSKSFYLETDAKLFLSYTKIPVDHGEAEIWQSSINTNLMIGYRFK